MHSTRSHTTWLSNTCQSSIRAQNIAMDLFWDLLCQRDIRGSYQCQVRDRCNLILTNLSDFEEKACKATLLYPEGQSAAMLLSNQEFQPRKTAWDNSVLVLDISSRNKMTDLKSHNDNIEFWVFNVLDNWNVAHESDAQYLLDDETEIVPIAKTKKGTLKVLELFCGGYGGWRSTFEFLHDHFQIDAQIFGIDKDLHAIQTYAATNKTVLVNGMQNLPWKFFKDFTQHAAIHADIHSFKWLAAVGMWKPDMITIPAAGPNGETTSGEIQRTPDKLFAEAMAICRILQPRVIAIEQSGEFQNHETKAAVMRLIPWAGFKLTWAETLNLKSQCPVNRVRWLAIATRSHNSDCTPSDSKTWNSYEEHTAHTFDAILPEDLALDDRLQISTDIRDTDAHDTYDDKEVKKPAKNTCASTCCQGYEVLPTFTAEYGSQQAMQEQRVLPDASLQGLYKPNGCSQRLFHPIEVALLHVVYKIVFLPEDWTLAWKYLGNQTAIPHALITLVNALAFFKHIPSLNIKEVLDRMHKVKLTQSSMTLTKGCMGIVISDGSVNLDNEEHENIKKFHDECRDCIMPDGKFWDTKGFHNLPLTKNESMVQSTPKKEEELDKTETENQIDTQEIPCTVPFVTLLKGKLETSYGHLNFWFDATLTTEQIMTVWPNALTQETENMQEGVALTLTPAEVNPTSPSCLTKQTVLKSIFKKQLILLPPCEQSMEFISDNHSEVMFDQYAHILTPKDVAIPRVDIGMTHDKEFKFPFAHFQNSWRRCTCQTKIDHWDHFICISFKGPYEDRTFLEKFWKHLFSDDALTAVGYSQDYLGDLLV